MKKQGVFLYTAIAIAACLCISFTNDYLQKRSIRTQAYDIHFYIYSKERTAQRDRTYFWYRAGAIEQSFGKAGGPVLHDKYTKFYASKKLAESGRFYYGLQQGEWKYWHPNGHIYKEVNWQNGRRYGSYKEFDSSGNLLLTGRFSADQKVGKWIDHQAQDTTWYQGDRIYKERPSIVKKREDSLAGKVPLLKRIFKKKQKDSLSNPKDKKPSLWQRIFKKKTDSVKTKQ